MTTESNAVLAGGPQPVGSRYVYVEQAQADVRATAADGSGLHVWVRSSRFQAKAGGGMLRVFVYAGPDFAPGPIEGVLS